MNPGLPSAAELDALAQQVNDPLHDLQSQPASEAEFNGVSPGKRARLLVTPKQPAVIEKATGEPFESFWEKFKRHPRWENRCQQFILTASGAKNRLKPELRTPWDSS